MIDLQKAASEDLANPIAAHYQQGTPRFAELAGKIARAAGLDVDPYQLVVSIAEGSWPALRARRTSIECTFCRTLFEYGQNNLCPTCGAMFQRFSRDRGDGIIQEKTLFEATEQTKIWINSHIDILIQK